MGHKTRCLTGQSNLRLLLTVALSALVAGACKKTDQTSAIDTTGATAVAAETDTVPPLPAISADSMQVLIAPGNWDDTPGRKFTGTLNCGDGSTCGGKIEVSFRIRPRTNAHSIDHRKALDGEISPIHVAQITNTDNVDYGPWNIARGATAYLKVGDRVSGQRRIAIYSINPSTGSETLLVTARAAAKCDMGSQPAPKVHPWRPPHCRGAKDIEILYGNPNVAAVGTPKASIAKLASFSLVKAPPPPPEIDQGLWITCSGGCCEGSRFN